MTVLFNILMVFNQLVKLKFLARVNIFFEKTDLAAEYIDFESFLKETDRVLFYDVILYYLYIVVMVNVLFEWLPD